MSSLRQSTISLNMILCLVLMAVVALRSVTVGTLKNIGLLIMPSLQEKHSIHHLLPAGT